jgi:hypothetical protein
MVPTFIVKSLLKMAYGGFKIINPLSILKQQISL